MNGSQLLLKSLELLLLIGRVNCGSFVNKANGLLSLALNKKILTERERVALRDEIVGLERRVDRRRDVLVELKHLI